MDILSGKGSPWLLGTNEIGRYALTFLRANKKYVRRMLEFYPHLENYVDARNTTSIQWLKWLGFEFDLLPVPYGVWKMPFFRFEMKAKKR